jgi:hypothetical protein
MATPPFGLRALVLVVFTFSLESMAEAVQPKRTYVSVNGNDANVASQCQIAAPCGSFQAALSVVRAGGEVRALDDGGFGAVTITQAVTLSGPHDLGVGVATSSGDAITVAAGPSDEVVIRGLTLKGLGPNAGNGINATSFGALHVEGCVIDGFSSVARSGIAVAVTANGSRVFIRDTILRNNWNCVKIGTIGNSASVAASIDRSRAEDSNDGFVANGGARVTLSNCIASNNLLGGFHTVGPFPFVQMNCDSCVASTNGSGFLAQAGIMRVKGSTSTNNKFGFSNLGAIFFLSLGNNMVSGNDAFDVVGNIDTLPPT